MIVPAAVADGLLTLRIRLAVHGLRRRRYVRVLTEIPDDDVNELDALASRRKTSRAAAIRDAVKLYLGHNAGNNDWIKRGRGYWKHRPDIGDGLNYQQAIRHDRTVPDEL